MKNIGRGFIALFLVIVFNCELYCANNKAVELFDSEVSLTPEFSVNVPAPRISLDGRIIVFTCLKTPAERNVSGFCPLSLEKEAKYCRGISARRYGNDVLAVFSLEDKGGEEEGSYWVRLCRISGSTGKLLWQAEGGEYDLSNPGIIGKFAYITSMGRISKLDLETGEKLWELKDLNKNDSYFSFRTPVLKDGVVTFADYQKNKILVDDKTGNIISWDDPKSKRHISAWAGLGAMAVSGYMFYEMYTDKNREMAWTVLALNVVGWTDQSFFDVPFLDDGLSGAFLAAGAVMTYLYPLVTLPYAMGANDKDRIVRSLSGICVTIGVPIIGMAIKEAIQPEKTDRDDTASITTELSPVYAGVKFSSEF